MRITTDTGRCIGAGQCALTAPELFDQDQDAVVVLVADRADGALLDAAREAADLCPARAISLVPDRSG